MRNAVLSRENRQMPIGCDYNMSEANQKKSVKKLNVKTKYWFLILLITALTTLKSSPTYAITSHEMDIYRLYAHTQIVNYKQFQCFDTLITRESHYDPKAHNGTHYGLVQGNSKWLRTQDAYTQIDWGIRYVKARYNGQWCKALAHSNKHGWY